MALAPAQPKLGGQRQLKLGARFTLTGYTPSDRADHVYRTAQPCIQRGPCGKRRDDE